MYWIVDWRFLYEVCNYMDVCILYTGFSLGVSYLSRFFSTGVMSHVHIYIWPNLGYFAEG